MVDEKKTNKPIWLLTFLLLGLIAVGLIGGFVGTFLSKTTDGEVEVEKVGQEATSISEKEGFVFEAQGELPKDFPENFPAYPASILTSSGSVEGNEIKAFSVVWETKDSVENVTGYYKKELTALDWEISLTSETKDSATLSFGKDGISGFVGIAAEEAKTVIAATLGIK